MANLKGCKRERHEWGKRLVGKGSWKGGGVERGWRHIYGIVKQQAKLLKKI